MIPYSTLIAYTTTAMYIYIPHNTVNVPKTMYMYSIDTILYPYTLHCQSNVHKYIHSKLTSLYSCSSKTMNIHSLDTLRPVILLFCSYEGVYGNHITSQTNCIKPNVTVQIPHCQINVHISAQNQSPHRPAMHYQNYVGLYYVYTRYHVPCVF